MWGGVATEAENGAYAPWQKKPTWRCFVLSSMIVFMSTVDRDCPPQAAAMTRPSGGHHVIRVCAVAPHRLHAAFMLNAGCLQILLGTITLGVDWVGPASKLDMADMEEGLIRWGGRTKRP